MRWNLRPAIVFLVAVPGTAAGHMAGYLVAHRDAAERAQTLSSSGHGYWDAAVSIALIGACAALLGELGIGYLRGRAGASHPGFKGTWLALAASQSGLFAGVEILERVLSGSGVEVLSEPAVWIGIPVQVVFAALGAMILGGASWTGARIAHRTVMTGRRSSDRAAVRSAVPPLVVVFVSDPARAPPWRFCY